MINKQLKTKIEHTSPYTPEQNGMVECSFSFLYANVRATLNSTYLNGYKRERLWDECANTMTYLDVITVNNGSQCPYELFYKRPPKLIKKLIRWGRRAIIKENLGNIKGKLTNRGTEAMFADDLNVFQKFDRRTINDAVTGKLGQCKQKVHSWGVKNRVSFDASKEHIVIIHPQQSFREPFKLLGCMVDTKLTMRQAVDAILANVRPRVKALLRTRPHYSPASLIDNSRHMCGP